MSDTLFSICNPKSLEKDTWVACPFDQNHIMPQSSFVRHVINCRDKNPNSNLVCCPFNAFCFLLPQDVDEHVEMYHEYEKKEMLETKKRKEDIKKKQQDYNIELILEKPDYVDDALYTKCLELSYNHEGLLGMVPIRYPNI